MRGSFHAQIGEMETLKSRDGCLRRRHFTWRHHNFVRNHAVLLSSKMQMEGRRYGAATAEMGERVCRVSLDSLQTEKSRLLLDVILVCGDPTSF